MTKDKHLNNRQSATLGKHWNPFWPDIWPGPHLGDLTTLPRSPIRLGRGNTLPIPHRLHDKDGDIPFDLP